MNKTYISLPTIHIDEFTQKGKNIYKEIKDKLEKEAKGKFIAIEVDSGKYFIGKDQMEAFKKARKEFPKKIFYFVRIGFPSVFTHSSHYNGLSYGSVL